MLRLAISLLLAFVVSKVCAECDVCQAANKVACHSETTFSLCVNGEPTRDIIPCPENYHCTADNVVCYPKTESVASCVVNPESTPTSSTTTESVEESCEFVGDSLPNPSDSTCGTYFYCSFVGNTLTKVSTDCPTGQWFDAVDRFCTAEKPAGCAETTTSTTTIATTVSPEVACQRDQKTQNFVNPNDASCLTFLYCYRRANGAWVTSESDCDEGAWFSVEVNRCVAEKPAGCL